jgi:hypothetical protein
MKGDGCIGSLAAHERADLWPNSILVSILMFSWVSDTSACPSDWC